MGDNNTLQSAITRLKQQTGIFYNFIYDDLLSENNGNLQVFNEMSKSNAEEIKRCSDVLEEISESLYNLSGIRASELAHSSKIKVGDEGYIPYKHNPEKFRKVKVLKIINKGQILVSAPHEDNFAINTNAFHTVASQMKHEYKQRVKKRKERELKSKSEG